MQDLSKLVTVIGLTLSLTELKIWWSTTSLENLEPERPDAHTIYAQISMLSQLAQHFGQTDIWGNPMYSSMTSLAKCDLLTHSGFWTDTQYKSHARERRNGGALTTLLSPETYIQVSGINGRIVPFKKKLLSAVFTTFGTSMNSISTGIRQNSIETSIGRVNVY